MKNNTRLSKIDWLGYLLLINRPYRFEAFTKILKDIESDEEYWELFRYVWMDSENLWQNRFFIDLVFRCNRPHRELMMQEKERDFLNNLPNKFLIYRGHTRNNRKGFSWTLSSGRAGWFARRFFNKSASVVSAVCNKKDIIAVFLERGEFEVVVDPINLEIKKINKLRRSKKLAAILNEAKRVFKLDLERSLHGPEHWEQVERNVIKLAENTSSCDIEVARLFAILHDCKRQDEEKDKGHGERGAEFAQELYDKGMLDIDFEQFLTLKFAIKHHNDGSVNSNPTTGVCWDADRLDLPRIGITPIADKLSTLYAKERLWSV